MNPKSEKKANKGVGNTIACITKNAIPVAKDSKVETINLSDFLKRKPLIMPRKRVIPKNNPFRIKYKLMIEAFNDRFWYTGLLMQIIPPTHPKTTSSNIKNDAILFGLCKNFKFIN
jgi:hypothetical protein